MPRFSELFSARPLLRLVGAAYRLVAGHRREVGDVRLRRLKLAVCLAMGAGLLLSPKLWVSSRSYPLMPVWTLLPTIPFPLDYAVFVALILLLGTAAAVRKPGLPLVAILTIAGSLGVLDQNRWQPWFYQYLFMLGALALHDLHREPCHVPGATLNTCRVILASVYLWSGLHKFSRSFINETFPWFLQGLGAIPAEMLEHVSRLGVAVPILEAGIGVGLIAARWRRTSMILAILMHIFLLVSLGPLGHDVNIVVWPWNLAMIAFVVLLFRSTARIEAREILSPRNGRYHAAVLVLFAVLPALSFVHLWDSYLSFSMYSADVNARIYVSDGMRDDLPSDVRVYVREDERGRNLLDHQRWSSVELKVPTHPEARTYRRLALYCCRYAKVPGDVELVIEQRSPAAVWRSLVRFRLDPTLQSTSRYDCASLRP